MTNQTIHRLYTMHCSNHKDRGPADAVWGEALCFNSDTDPREIDQNTAKWRIVSFDGRRGKTLVTRTKAFSNMRDAEKVFVSKANQKIREGYVPVEWVYPDYGLIQMIRDIDPDTFDMVIAESTRLGMDLSSPLWRAVSGINGYPIPRMELIANFNAANGNARYSTWQQQRTLTERRERDVREEQALTSGRFAPDPSIGSHVFLWNGLGHDALYDTCGVCSRPLGKHARLVVNYQGRLARHIFVPKVADVLCRACNLQRADFAGREVHSRFDDRVEFISRVPPQSVPTPTEVQRLELSDEQEVMRRVGEIARQQIGDRFDSLFIGGPITVNPQTSQDLPIRKPDPIPSDSVPKAPKPEKKPTKPDTHERTGGLLDFDI